MAAATFDAKNQVSQGRPQTTRRVEIPFGTLDFTATGGLGDGTGLAQNEDMEIGVIPAGYTHEYLDPKLIVAEGEAATLDVGTEASPTLFANALDMNGTPNAKIQLETIAAANAATQTGAYVQADVQTIATLANEIKADLNRLFLARGTYFHVNTPVRIRNPGANLINVAKLRLILVGYMTDTGLEK